MSDAERHQYNIKLWAWTLQTEKGEGSEVRGLLGEHPGRSRTSKFCWTKLQNLPLWDKTERLLQQTKRQQRWDTRAQPVPTEKEPKWPNSISLSQPFGGYDVTATLSVSDTDGERVSTTLGIMGMKRSLQAA